MVNPILTPKEAVRLTVSESAKKFFQVIYKEQNKVEVDDDEPKIKVSEIISKVAFYYEKIRNTVDDKEEHLLYKNAINRIIKRQLNIELTKDGKEISKHLLFELIRAGYLPNNKVPEVKIDEIGLIIDKYLKLKKVSLEMVPDSQEGKNDLSSWIISLAACEIEELLNRNAVTKLVINSMHEVLSRNIKFPEDSPHLRDKDIQIYIGIFRSYLKADDDMISYILFKYFIADWQEASDDTISKTAKNIIKLVDAINFQINHPASGRLNRIINHYTVYYSIMIEVIAEDPVATYEDFKKDPRAFQRNIKAACNKRYRSTKAKLWRAAVRSIIYLFVTKMILVLILEIPVAHLLGETPANYALAINVSFPPLLLFLIVLFTQLPSDANTVKINEGIDELVFVEKERKEPFKLRPPVKRSGARNVFFNIIYTITFFLTFGFVVWVLMQINFTIISMIIFLFFLALISFFSIRIRKRVRELMVIEQRENIFIFITDFFYVPIIAVGKWLSEKFSKLNVLVFILDFIFEAPFKVFVEIAEEWSRYVRERKEDISQ